LEHQLSIVAIVEDDSSVLRSVARLLNAYGFATEMFASAEAFLCRDVATEVSCVVLDIHLDGMSGIELRRRLQASGSCVPVIFMTGIDDRDLETRARRTGCVAYLHKPFPADLLIGAVNEALADPQAG
jgi:FixJ family two-component response regulator